MLIEYTKIQQFKYVVFSLLLQLLCCRISKHLVVKCHLGLDMSLAPSAMAVNGQKSRDGHIRKFSRSVIHHLQMFCSPDP